MPNALKGDLYYRAQDVQFNLRRFRLTPYGGWIEPNGVMFYANRNIMPENTLDWALGAIDTTLYADLQSAAYGNMWVRQFYHQNSGGLNQFSLLRTTRRVLGFALTAEACRNYKTRTGLASIIHWYNLLFPGLYLRWQIDTHVCVDPKAINNIQYRLAKTRLFSNVNVMQQYLDRAMQ